MKINKKSVSLIISVIVLILLAFIAFNGFMKKLTASDVFKQFQAFTVTIHNESDYDIISVETGITNGASVDIYSKEIKRGESVKIKPKLTLKSEGGIYLKYIDSSGKTLEQTVCGYTEYLSGTSIVTVNNDQVTVKQNCM